MLRFATALALGIALFVVLPYAAHRLRRRRADERAFAPAHLVPPAPPKARRRSALEDRGLFATRALAVLALAVLGASPFVRCSRLALARQGGASVAMAIVVDDSMSMRARVRGTSKFARAKKGAQELLASAREGDAIAVVLAGAPARVALAATTDLATARAAVDALVENDRATDLDGAVTLARSLVGSLAQVDKRVVVLSDLADGSASERPFGDGAGVPVWVPLPELREPATDCGVIEADRSGVRVRVRVACTEGAVRTARTVEVVAGSKVVGTGALPASNGDDVTVTVPEGTAENLVARLSGEDSVASDDAAPVLHESASGSLAVVADSAGETTVTGGAPVVEQALAALKLDVAMRPLPQVPDRAEDLAPFLGLVLDDPAGFTPEERRAVSAYLEDGGRILLALGPRAARAPLGATFEPVLRAATRFVLTTDRGAHPDAPASAFGEAARSLGDLEAHERTVLAPEDATAFEPLLRWNDGAPLLARRSFGRGEVWIVTLPFGVDTSEISIRPGFLALLDAWVDEARARVAPRRTDVGVPWGFEGAKSVSVQGPGDAASTNVDRSATKFTPPLVGTYTFDVDGRKEVRVAMPLVREFDWKPRKADGAAITTEGPASQTPLDVSPFVAFALLALMTSEIALRWAWSTRAEAR
ncbi:MAG: VWA domain-containing protein [Polyangiaceae bacterium]